LVFSLRPADDQISQHDAKTIWNNIVKSKGRSSALLLSRGVLDTAERWKESRPPKAPAQEVLDMLLAKSRPGWVFRSPEYAKSTRTISCIKGNKSTRPGPLTLWKRPSKCKDNGAFIFPKNFHRRHNQDKDQKDAG